MSASISEIGAMRRAIVLSALGLSTTSPNPPVGCVILDSDGRPVGEGYHQCKGEPHAEVRALAAANGQAQGGTALVTLEPCNHYGRTPPCHQALIDAGIARVLIAVIDPTSRGVGGAARLRDAGIDVEVDVLAVEARVVLGSWLSALDTGRPRVAWVCDATDGLPQQASDNLIVHAGLQLQVDAVVRSNGQVDEGLTGEHGRGAFDLPRLVPVDEPDVALSLLQRGGVRTVLLHGGSNLADPFAKRHLIDTLAMFVADPAVSPSSFAIEHAATIWSGFTIRSVRRLNSGVLFEATASPLADNNLL
jgi:diaminohydroxyphosphoribosylaminopyrimidine deaminase/5-amino-6-(5-phosphoribosylamino)uracil reductase